MKARDFLIQLIALGVLLFPWETAQANPIPSQLAGRDLVSGKDRAFTLSESSKGTVIVFLSAKCPCSASHEQKLRELYAQFSSQGFRFVGIHSNADEPWNLSSRHFSESKLPFPVIEDAGSTLANQMGALKTPHVFVVSPQAAVLFQGGVDDSHIAQVAKKQYLQEALVALSAGQTPPRNAVRALGCVIKRP